MPRISRFLLAVPAVAVMATMAACSGTPARSTAELPTDLQKDLELAKASSLELASAAGARTQVVSGLEGGQAGAKLEGDRAPMATPAPRARRERTPVARRVAERTVEAPVADVAEETPAPATDEVEAPAASVAAEPAPEPAAAPAEPVVMAGPQSTEDGAGSSRPRDPGGWGDAGTGDVGRGGGWGGLGGVIIRGGSIGDDDHCEIRPRRGTMGSAGRFPIGGTIYVPRAGGTGGAARAGGGMTRSRGGFSTGGFSGGSGAVSAPSAPSGPRSRGGR